jgi:hypothetical protein
VQNKVLSISPGPHLHLHIVIKLRIPRTFAHIHFYFYFYPVSRLHSYTHLQRKIRHSTRRIPQLLPAEIKRIRIQQVAEQQARIFDDGPCMRLVGARALGHD